jgi:hypothetical protein
VTEDERFFLAFWVIDWAFGVLGAALVVFA